MPVPGLFKELYGLLHDDTSASVVTLELRVGASIIAHIPVECS